MLNDLAKSLFWCYALSAVLVVTIVFVLFTMEWWKNTCRQLMEGARACTMSCWSKMKSFKFKSKKNKKGTKGRGKGKKGKGRKHQSDHDPIW